MSILAILLCLVIGVQRQTIARLKQELLKSESQRLLELNQLMVGLAHEVRNPLNSIRLNLYTADRVFRGDAQLASEEITAMLGESVREIERVDGLMNLLLAYARADDLEVNTVDLRREIHSVAAVMEPTLQASRISLKLSLPAKGEFLTRAGRGHVRQVLLNLLSNSKEAIPETGGKIEIDLKQHQQMVEVNVTDSGSGISAAHRDLIFAPFYSTKEQSSGLGLAITRSLMERAGGTVNCVRVDRGQCQFRVRWPAHRNQSRE
ncbi:sensor histidine kinase [Schlesneria sp. T3-172]|uniref:sensor histidine kinase n=1 Tax=Schlesneria sphaerica TaxID=3373610 RepID=UPI0037C7D511